MNPANWIHPGGIDYSDAFNPVARRGYNLNNAPFVYHSWQEPIFQGLRYAVGIEGRLWVCPTPDQQTIPGLTTIDFQVPSEPNTWLFGYSAISNPGSTPDAASFQFQITDSLTGATVFNSPMLASQVYPNANLKGVVKFLSAPRLFVPPAYPTVRIVNQSTSAQVCAVYLWCAIETDVLPIP